jgi:acetyl-CoA synthetase
MTHQHFINLSTIYEQNEKVKISLQGKKLDKMKSQALENPEQFWGEQAKNLVWFKQWDNVLDSSRAPFYKWFVGGKLNASVNCLDRHIDSDLKNKVAIIWEAENRESRSFTYFQVASSVNKFASALKKLGVKKGDRVTIYLPMVPELPITMLACARIGAIHTVLFSGFSGQALIDRVSFSQWSFQPNYPYLNP